MSDKEDEPSKMEDCYVAQAPDDGNDFLVVKVGEYEVEIEYDHNSEKTVDDRITELAKLYLQTWE